MAQPKITHRVLWLCCVALAALLLFASLPAGRQAIRDFPNQLQFPGGYSLTTRAFVEVRHLSAAIKAFQAHWKVSHIPSRIRLSKDFADYDLREDGEGKPVNPLDRDSADYLLSVWPQLNTKKPIDWSGGLVGFRSVILQGDQCLVFFLGGIPQRAGSPGCLGFSTDPTNPAAPTVDRLSPFYEFRSTHLVNFHGNGFSSYLDPWGVQPIAYFSLYGHRNGYNRYFSVFANSDCARLGVWPYAERLGESPLYLNPDSFQVLCAGKDGRFGRGSRLPAGRLWTNQSAQLIDDEGQDDLGNFHSLLLGVPSH